MQKNYSILPEPTFFENFRQLQVLKEKLLIKISSQNLQTSVTA